MLWQWQYISLAKGDDWGGTELQMLKRLFLDPWLDSFVFFKTAMKCAGWRYL